MPEPLTTLLQQHVDQLTHSPAGGFAGVRAKARRRTRTRAALAGVALVAVVVAGIGIGGRLDDKSAGPADPRPTAPANGLVQLTGTRWQVSSVTDNGRTVTPAVNEAWLVLGWDGQWLLKDGCGSLSGPVSFGDQVGLTVRNAPGPSDPCARQPLASAIADVMRWHSGSVAHLIGESLTVTSDVGTLHLQAGQQPMTADITGRRWQLTSWTSPSGSDALSGSALHGLTWTFGADTFVAGDSCTSQSGIAVPGDDVVDFASNQLEPQQTCPAAPARLKAAYRDLLGAGQVSAQVTGDTLTLDGGGVTLRLTAAGPNPGGLAPTRPDAPGAPAALATLATRPTGSAASVGAGNDPAQSARLAGTWRLTQLEHGTDTGSIPVDVPATVTIARDGTWSGQDGCNAVRGRFVVGSESLAEAGGQLAEAGGQLAEAGGQLAEAGGQLGEVSCTSLGGAIEPLVDQALLWAPRSWAVTGDQLSIGGSGVTLTYLRTG